MPRGYPIEIRYKRNRYPKKFAYGRKVRSDHGHPSYEGRLSVDDYGMTYDARYETPDLDLGPGGGGRTQP